MTARREPAAADDWLERAREGDPVIWTDMVTDLGPVIRGYARARGVPDPDDLTQDVFTAAAQRIGGFSGTWADFRSWLFSIAYRQVVNRYRASAKRTEALPATLVDPGPSPETVAVARVTAGVAVEALEVLDGLERDVVLMRVLGGLDAAEVGAAVGKRPGHVRVIQFRAMAKLREELVRRGYGEGERQEDAG